LIPWHVSCGVRDMISKDMQVQAAATRAQVKDTLRQSGAKSGTDFAYLLKVADGESRFQANAKAKNSSASGVFQFTEQTWLQMVKTHGAKYGLAREAEAIKLGKGRLEVPDAASRQAILARRHDPKLATQMATELAGDNRKFLEKRLGRKATEGEVYAAHAFGPSGALRMIQTRASQPNQPGNQVLPAAARTNQAIFYDRATNAPRSTEQIMARLDSVVANDASRKRVASLLGDDMTAALLTLHAA
jgi:hypothetical protein